MSEFIVNSLERSDLKNLRCFAIQMLFKLVQQIFRIVAFISGNFALLILMLSCLQTNLLSRIGQRYIRLYSSGLGGHGGRLQDILAG
mmetsp:Transcript_42572/g.83704  ORF Transcript_42572/g.83704 Transcript_42572/m.83704 type:complete len:87 (-) Transcript_42572:189-449(-)